MPFDAHDSVAGIRRPAPSDADEFTTLMLASRALHGSWVDFPTTQELFQKYLQTRNGTTDDGFLVCDAGSGRIAGLINLNVITRGALQSAYLGYGIGAAYARRGYMTAGLKLVTAYAFREMGLHRLEANIQPDNFASIALVRKCRFHREGFSPRYLKIADQWRDHERWALLAD